MYIESDFTELNQSLVTQTSRIYVRNGIVVCTIAFKITAQVSAYNNLLTLPIKPSGETNVIFSSLNGTSVPCYINSATGKLGVRANMPVSEWYAANFSFML